MKSATLQLIELAERLNPTGEIGDGTVAQFHELAARARVEVGANCAHRKPFPGPRLPLRYGSAATLICDDCGMWRQNRPGFGDEDWRPIAELEQGLAENEVGE